MRPEDVGAAQTRLVLGKHSGRHALRVHLVELGFPLDGEPLDRAFVRFKTLADRKKDVSDADLEALVLHEDACRRPRGSCSKGCRSPALTASMATATCPTSHARTATSHLPGGRRDRAGGRRLQSHRRHRSHAARPSRGIRRARRSPKGSMRSGKSARSSIRRKRGTRRSPQTGTSGRAFFHGHGADTDILVASAKAYVAAINRMLSSTHAPAPHAAQSKPRQGEAAA